ncbi:putative nucleotidyltransferase with HDIG domain [Natronocella acetinitrilica]|uniref:Nucleotidyltransferase with HDIG domain n=1 Tax=Natronocella acetinitrilica TaxID=414046 RepID=A0AAE3G1R3_9GAMM|nr:HDOD domain-containing protein [Natronocella acetinitrilica]MCP1674040.1 putative nucleotidyltransferase with HDIG domain [Natronocella acetinitrilica]
MSTPGDFMQDLVAIQQGIAKGTIVLPGVPQVAGRVRRILAESEPDQRLVATEIARDPGLASYLIKLANSAANRGVVDTDSVNGALQRLGLQLTGVMVTNYALMQMVNMAGGIYRDRVQSIYRHSLEVAAHCHALAVAFTRLPADRALLVGLVHDIGKLVVLQFAADRPALRNNPQRLEQVLRYTHASVGAGLLRVWRFPEPVVSAVAAHESWRRETADGTADLADLVIAAQVDLYRESDHPMAGLAARQVPSMDRLGLPEGMSFREWPEFQQPYQRSCALLGL